MKFEIHCKDAEVEVACQELDEREFCVCFLLSNWERKNVKFE